MAKTVGFGVDLAELLIRKPSVSFTSMPIDFKGIIPALTGKRIDAIVSGMYINDARKEVADFTPCLDHGCVAHRASAWDFFSSAVPARVDRFLSRMEA